ncbi:MAG: Fic family protein [Cyanobacteria bacterium]|nr:Fic family protein [Cyanobacteriota bacterium]
MFIYQHPDWPNFYWQPESLTEKLAATRHAQGRLVGRMEALGFSMQQEAILETLTQDVLKSNEIEGEHLDNQQVRSSIARRMGLDVGGLVPSDREVEGVVEMMLDATGHFDQPLTEERLLGWHRALFPSGRSGLHRIRVGALRDDAGGPMEVVSGPIGKEKIHYQAPDAQHLEGELNTFLNWLNTDSAMDLVLKAAVAHFWFLTLHPFEDGNGRIARAIADMILTRSEGSSNRFYSMSTQIQRERESYYDILERSQKGSMDITPWMIWFLDCLGRAIEGSQASLEKILKKASFWESLRPLQLNERQMMMLNRLLDGFEGKLTSTKWAKLAHCSQDTASRDIQDLLNKKILIKDAPGGRSTSYSITIFK